MCERDRGSRIHLLGSSRRRTSTPGTMPSLCSPSTRDSGASLTVPSSVILSLWLVTKVTMQITLLLLLNSQFSLFVGMALAPFGVLASGKIRTDAEEEKRRQTGEKGQQVFGSGWERNEREKEVCKALKKVAAEIGAKHIGAGMSFARIVLSELC